MAPQPMGTLCAGADFKFLKPSYSSFVQCKMGQNYTKYCHVSSMLKYPVDSFNETAARREEIYGKTDFVLVVKGTHFQVHKEVLMKSSRYFETMLTLFDERLKSEVELKDIVEAPTMALTLHFIYEGHVTGVRKRLLNKRNVHDLLQLAIYLQMQLLQSLCIKFIQDRLEKKNCIPLYQQTLDMGPFELQCIIEEYILQHFEAIGISIYQATMPVTVVLIWPADAPLR